MSVIKIKLKKRKENSVDMHRDQFWHIEPYLNIYSLSVRNRFNVKAAFFFFFFFLSFGGRGGGCRYCSV